MNFENLICRDIVSPDLDWPKWIHAIKRIMKRWMLGIAQIIVALSMMPQVFFFGVPGALGSLGMSESGHFDADLSGVPKLYFWSLLVASFSLVIAAILSLSGAALSLVKPSQVSVRLCIAGVVCYWIFIVALLEVSSALGIHLSLRYLTAWDVIQYPIGIVAAIVAYALYSLGKVRVLP